MFLGRVMSKIVDLTVFHAPAGLVESLAIYHLKRDADAVMIKSLVQDVEMMIEVVRFLATHEMEKVIVYNGYNMDGLRFITMGSKDGRIY